MKLIFCKTVDTEPPETRQPHISNENQTFMFRTYQDHQAKYGYTHGERHIRRLRLKHGNHIFRSETNHFKKN